MLSLGVRQDISCIEWTLQVGYQPYTGDVAFDFFLSDLDVRGTMSIYWGRFFCLGFISSSHCISICQKHCVYHPSFLHYTKAFPIFSLFSPSPKGIVSTFSILPPGQNTVFLEMKTPRASALILDLGDVLLNRATTTKAGIPGKTIKAIVSSHIWMDFERGRISEEVCYERAGKYFGVPLDKIIEAFMHSRDTLLTNEALVSFLKDLRKALDGSLKIYAMSNMSKEDYTVLSQRILGWSIFDEVFTSGNIGSLKPDLGFYRFVLEATNTPPQAAVFVDDKFENTLSADSLGMRGIIFDNNPNVIRKLLNIFGDPVLRGKDFLARNAEQLQSVTESGVTIDENFAQLLILSATKDQYCPLFPIALGQIANFNFFLEVS